MKKWIGMILLLITTMGLLAACGSDDIEDQVANIVQAEDTHVLSVKGGTPNIYPGRTYGEAFEATYLSFNDVPQNIFMLSVLLEAVFTDEDLDAAVENNSDETVQENEDAIEQQGMDCSFEKSEY